MSEVFRVKKTKDFTVMSNRHLRDKRLSLKGKGLLSLILSLPDNWDYSIKGFTKLVPDGVDSVRTALKELTSCGYIEVSRKRDSKGRLSVSEYTIYEEPKQDKPDTENPVLDKPDKAKPVMEKPSQLSKKEINTEILNKDVINNQSINQNENDEIDNRKIYRFIIKSIDIGSYKGFDMLLSYDSFTQEFHLDLQRDLTYTVILGTSEIGNIVRIDNTLDSIEKRLESARIQLDTLNEQLETAKSELGKPFVQEEELQSKLSRLSELNTLLNIDGNASENVDIAAEKKSDISTSGDEMKQVRNVNSEKKSSILGRIKEMNVRQGGGNTKENTLTKDNVFEIS